MPQTWKTVRVFISSTFHDMQAERDHLIRFVFPRLREELLKRRIHLVDVDLRWGVTSEQDSTDVCREIIDECRPSFICMLGGRYGSTPQGRRYSITEDEIRYGVLDRLGQHGYAFFYFRSPEASFAMTEMTPGEFREPSGSDDEKKLSLLKQEIVNGGLKPFVYSPRWHKKRHRLIELESFGNQVYEDILRSINDEFGTKDSGLQDEFVENHAAMEAFAEYKTRQYIVGSRKPVLDRMIGFAESNGSPNVLLLTGSAGLGKSALLAKFYRDYPNSHPGDVVIPHFMGATIGSTDLRSTLRCLCHELLKAKNSRLDIAQDFKQITRQFFGLLKDVSEKRRVVLIFDALNQLDASDKAYRMEWLPHEFPSAVRVIASSVEHSSVESLRRRFAQITEMRLGALEAEDTVAIIKDFLWRYRKGMSPDQINLLAGKQDISNPLYLLAILEELRTLGTYEEISDRIRELPDKIHPFFVWVLKERLSKDPDFIDRQGSPVGMELVRKFVSAIGTSRHGLSQAELVELIDPDDSLGNVMALQRLLRSYLMYRGELIDFCHSQFRRAVESEFLGQERERLSAHHELGCYFRRKADPAENSTWTGDYFRGVNELTYHLYHYSVLSGRHQDYFDLLDDKMFKKKRHERCGSRNLLMDVEYALDLAVRGMDPVSLSHFSIMRFTLTRIFWRMYLYRLVKIAQDKPETACDVIMLIPDPEVRRLGFILLGWMCRNDVSEKGLVHELLANALNVKIPVSLPHTPLLLQMIRGLYEAGFDESASLLDSIPLCAMRSAYQAAWKNPGSRTTALSVRMGSHEASAPQAKEEEIKEFNELNLAVEFFKRAGFQVDMDPSYAWKFEDRNCDRFGPKGASNVYFLMAAEMLATGDTDLTKALINRGIYLGSSIQMPPIRTLAAMVGIFAKSGNLDMAKEHFGRIEAFEKGSRYLAKTKDKLGELEDALIEIKIALNNVFPASQPASVRQGLFGSSFEDGVDPQRGVNALKNHDVLSLVSNARYLLATGSLSAAQKTLDNIVLEVKRSDLTSGHAVLLSVYFMSCVCKSGNLMSFCSSQLKKGGLDPETLLKEEDAENGTRALLELLIRSDTRCVSATALSFRLLGLRHTLLEFMHIASTEGADLTVLDAILSELIKLDNLAINAIRRMSDEILLMEGNLIIPSGLGYAYYPAIMLIAIWTGTGLTSIGFAAASASPTIVHIGLVFILAGIAGGLLDLFIWRFTGLWKNPEKSRRLTNNLAGTFLVNLAVYLFLKISGWNTSFPHGHANSTSVWCALLIVSAVYVFFLLKGLIFSLLSAKFIIRTSFLTILLSACGILFFADFLKGFITTLDLQGIFIIGAASLMFGANVLPKHIAVYQFYKEKIKLMENEKFYSGRGD